MWIDATKLLPEQGQEVLITGHRRDVSGLRFKAIAVHSERDEGVFYDADTGDLYYPPTHWMPIPDVGAL